MTIEIPADLAGHLAEAAAVLDKTVEQVAVERLMSFNTRGTSPQYLLGAIRGSARPSAEAVSDLEAVIASNRLPVREVSAFDRRDRR